MKHLICTVTALAISLTGLTAAEEVKDASAKKADKVLRESLAYLNGLSSLSAQTNVTVKQSMPGQEPREQSVRNTVLFRKDGPFAVQAEKQEGPSFSYLDGTAELELPGSGVVRAKAESAAAATRDSNLGFGADGGNPFLDRDVAAAVLRGMLFHGKDRPWDKNFGDFNYEGEEEVGGTRMHRIAFTTTDDDEARLPCLLWISAGETPFPQKLTIDMSPIVAKAMKQDPSLKGMEVSMTAGYSDWKPGADLPAEAFELKIAADAEPASSVEELMKRGRPAPPADALVGTEAPDFELKLLDGSDFKLSALKDKVVVLDFWATWCGPCVRALPILMATVKEFEDKGVVLVGVNLREEKSVVEEFLEKQDWNLTVALDSEGKAGELYKVTGIPQTVIIGKDGKIKAVHVGANPATFKAELSRELKEALGTE